VSNTLLPSTLARAALPEWQFPAHIQALQRAVLQTLYDPDKNRLVIEIPVRHGKSFYCSYILPSWYIMTHPNKSVWVVSYGSDFATEWSSKVRSLVGEWGPKLTGVHLDPKYKPRAHFRLAPPHTGDLRGLGIYGGIAGKGAHLIVCDDLVKEFGEVATEEGRDKLYKQFHGELLGRLEPGGKIIMVMSRRHPDDLSGKLLESNAHLEPREQWHRLKFPALSDDGERALWPERYDAKKLRAIKRDHELAGTEWQWYSLYQQDPSTAAELCEWPAKYWQDLYYHELPEFKPRFRFLALDPAKGKKAKKGDYSALLYGLVDPQGTLWIDDPILKRIPTTQLEELAAAQVKQKNPDAFAIETNNFQECIALNIYKLAPAAKIYPYENTENKEIRIRMILTPLLAQGLVKIRDTPQGRILGNQLRDFPLGSHDDGPDALALMRRLWLDLLGTTGQPTGGDQRIYTT